MTPGQKAQWSATGSVVAQKAVTIALNTVISAAQSPSDAGDKADWLDSLSTGLRAQAPGLVTSDDFKAIAAIWTPANKPHWQALSNELADLYERTKDLPEAERTEAIARGLNAAAARARIPVGAP